jgi:hypothetical protein
MGAALRAVAGFAGLSPEAAKAYVQIIEVATSGLYSWHTYGTALMERRLCYRHKRTAYWSAAGTLRHASNHCLNAHVQMTLSSNVDQTIPRTNAPQPK